MKKNICFLFLIFAVICSVIFSGCNKSNIESESEIIKGVKISAYETKYNGNLIKDYPSKIFTDTTILNLIENSTGNNPIEIDEPVKVLYKLIYYTYNNEEVSVLIQNTGKCTFMSIGLPQNIYYLTSEELSEVLKMLE